MRVRLAGRGADDRRRRGRGRGRGARRAKREGERARPVIGRYQSSLDHFTRSVRQCAIRYRRESTSARCERRLRHEEQGPTRRAAPPGGEQRRRVQRHRGGGHRQGRPPAAAPGHRLGHRRSLPRGGPDARLDPRAEWQHAADAEAARGPHLPQQQAPPGAAGLGDHAVERGRAEGVRRVAPVRGAGVAHGAHGAQRRRVAHRAAAVRRHAAAVRRRARAPPRRAQRRARLPAQPAARADQTHQPHDIGRGVPKLVGHQEHLFVRRQPEGGDGGGAARAARGGGAPRGAHAGGALAEGGPGAVPAAGAPGGAAAGPGRQRRVLRAAGHRARRVRRPAAAQGHRQQHQGAKEKSQPHNLPPRRVSGGAAGAGNHVGTAAPRHCECNH